jgi:membrane protease YdiL (CAAX protease family)
MIAPPANSCSLPSASTAQPAKQSKKILSRFHILLLLETILAAAAATGLIILFSNSASADVSSFLIPAVLILAAIVPTAIRKHTLKQIGLNINQIRLSIRLLFWTSLLIFPTLFIAAWLLKTFGINLPLQQNPLLQNNWTYWIFYQFLFVALTEEIFFRGYLQSNIFTLAENLLNSRRKIPGYTAVFISALLFAAAHVAIRAQISAILTFFPGLVLGWLFLRTKSLVAPILFHGLANTCYALLCINLV